MMGNAFGFGLPGLGMFLVWGLVILLVIWIVGALGKGNSGGDRDARQILDKRFARGEIGQEEYEEKKKSLA